MYLYEAYVGVIFFTYLYMYLFFHQCFNWMWNKSVGDQDYSSGLNSAVFSVAMSLLQPLYVFQMSFTL